MPFNGGGTFTRLYSWVADAAAGIDITASRTDADSNDIVANGLGNCITRDGQGQPTANLPMNGFRHTGAQAAQGAGDYVTLGQVQGTSGTALTASIASLTTSGAAAVGGTLGVTGAATLSSTLNCASTATFSSNVTVAGSAALNGGISTTSGTFSSGVTVIGSAALNGASTAIAGSLSVTGAANFTASVALTGTTNSVSGPLVLGSTLSVGGLASLASVNVSGQVVCNGGAGGAATGAFINATGGSFTPTAWAVNISLAALYNISAAGFYSVSDERVKSGIEDITPTDGEVWVMSGRPRTYTMDGRKRSGFIAQEDMRTGRDLAISIVPDDRPAFAEASDFTPAGHRLSRDYNSDIAYLTAALQSALKRIAILEAAHP